LDFSSRRVDTRYAGVQPQCPKERKAICLARSIFHISKNGLDDLIAVRKFENEVRETTKTEREDVYARIEEEEKSPCKTTSIS
jgi:hypothetical protein